MRDFFKINTRNPEFYSETLEGPGAKFARGHSIGAGLSHPSLEQRKRLISVGLRTVGAYLIRSAKDSLGPSSIKAKGCAAKEKYKIAPIPVPPYPESPP